MRPGTFILALLASASLAAASAVERWNTSTADTTTHHVNTANNKVAVGAWTTGNGGVAVGAKSTGANGVAIQADASSYGVRGAATGSAGIGVYGISPYRGVEGAGGEIGVHGEGTDAGVEGWSTAGYGLLGVGFNGAHGVRGSSNSGYAVHAVSQSGSAVRAVSTTGYALHASSSQGVGAYVTADDATGLVVSGKYSGAEIAATDLYGNGLLVSAGGRGYGIYTYGSYYGLYGGASSWDGYDNSHGVTGDAYGGDVTYGVTGYANGGNYENWAGYFEGNVYVAGYFDNPSDEKFKSNIRDYKGGLDRLLALRIRSYEMKVDEYKGRVHLPSGPQVGVIAQEAEKVFPEIVHATTAPARLTPEDRKKGVKKEDVKFKSVNYNALIPVLVQAIQELQAEVDALKAAQAGAR